MRLRVSNGSQLKLTYPSRLSKRSVLAWAAGQVHWVERQLSSLPEAEPFAPGAVIPLEGVDVELVWREGESRLGKLESGRLVIGGASDSFQPRVERYLRRLALDVLSRETAEIAAIAGMTVSNVSVGDASTRWGSCTSSARIRYSWRLILAPPAARRYVVAHEVAHLKELNHGPAFKSLERALFGGDVAAAQALLRSVGPRLRRLGLSG
jgi:predicted metal-dependent hydrolase